MKLTKTLLPTVILLSLTATSGLANAQENDRVQAASKTHKVEMVNVSINGPDENTSGCSKLVYPFC